MCIPGCYMYAWLQEMEPSALILDTMENELVSFEKEKIIVCRIWRFQVDCKAWWIVEI